MVSTSYVQSQSASNYKYTMANKDYEALANELGNSSYSLAAEEAFRQRKGITTEKKYASVVVQQPQPQPQPTQAPQQTGGYVVTMSHAQQNQFVREKQSGSTQSEDEFRRAHGVSTERSSSIKYVAPKLTTSNKSAASTGTKQTGVSNNKTGSEKIAAQSKTNASTNKATVKTTTKTTSTPAKKTTVSLTAAKSGNAAKTTSTAKKTVVTTKQAATGNAAKTTSTAKKTVVTTKQAASGNVAKTTSTAKTHVSLVTAKSGNVAKNTASTTSSGTGNVKKVNTPVSTKPQKTGLSTPVVRTATGAIVTQQTPKPNPNAARNTTGLSNRLTGSEKIAAQNKINANTNKAAIINRQAEAPKVVVGIDAARRGNAAATTPKPATSTGSAIKTIISLAAARGGNAGHGLNIPMARKDTIISASSANNLTGSQKLAAQSKINASTNKPTIIKKPVQQTPVQSTPIVTQKPTFQLTPFKPTAAPMILKNSTVTPFFNTTQTTTTKKSLIANLFGPDKSGFGIIGVASAKITAEDRLKYTKDPRFKPCPTGLCSIKWTNDQITKLKAADAQAAQTQQRTQTQTQTTQTTQTKQTQTQVPTQTRTQTAQTQTPVYVESQPLSIPVRNREDPQWHEAVQDILKQEMMAKYGLDYRGNRITSIPIKLADGTSIEQAQVQGNNGTEGVKIYTSQLTDAEKAQNWAAYQQRVGLGQTGYQKSVKSGSATKTVENKNAAEAKAAAKAEAARIKALQAAFTGNTKIGANGEVIDAIQSKGNSGKGSSGVSIVTRDESGNVTGVSKSQSQFKAEAKYREQVANTPIVAGMTSSDINTIKQARSELQARTLSKLTYPKDDKYANSDFFAAGATLNQNAQTMLTQKAVNTPVRTSPFKTRADVAAEKAVVEARKINPNGSQEYFEGVANVARRSTMSPTEVLASDYTRSMDILDTTASKVTKHLPTQQTIFESRKNLMQNELGSLPVVGSSIKVADTKAEAFVRNNAMANAIGSVATDSYNFAREKPARAAVELGKMYVEAEAFGAAFGAAKLLGRGVLGGASKIIEGSTETMLGNIAAKNAARELAIQEALKGKSIASEALSAANKKALSSTLTANSLKALSSGQAERSASKAAIGAIDENMAAREAYNAAAAKVSRLSKSPKVLTIHNVRGVSGITQGVLNTAAKSVDPITDYGMAYKLAKDTKELYDKGEYKSLTKSAIVLGLSASPFSKGAKFAEGSVERALPKFHSIATEYKNDISPFGIIKKPIDATMQLTGVTRGKALGMNELAGGDRVTLRSRGDVAEKVLDSPTIRVVRSQMQDPKFKIKHGKTFAGPEEGALGQANIYKIDSKTSEWIKLEKPSERKAAIEDIRRGNGDKYAVDDIDDPLVGTVLKTVPGKFFSLATDAGVEPYSELFIQNGPLINKNPMSKTGRTIQKAAIKVTNKLGTESPWSKTIAKVIDTENIGTSYNPRARRVLINDVRTVQLDPQLKATIKNEIKTTGGISRGNYDTMVDAAWKQSGELGEPIAIISPKTREAWIHPENEVYMVIHPNANKIASTQFAGYTPSGAKVQKITIGKQKPLKSSVLGNVAENVKYNTALGADEFGVYNKVLHKSEAYNMQRRIDELSGNALGQPQGWEYFKHGRGHVDAVEANMNKLSKQYPNAEVSVLDAKTRGQYHDVAKIGYKDTPTTNHGITAARAIRRNELRSPWLEKLTEAERKQLSRDIAYHDEIKPFSSGELGAAIKTKLIYKPSPKAKLLANADRMDLVRFDMKVKENKLFELDRIKEGENAKFSESGMTEKIFKKMMTEEAAEISPFKRRSEDLFKNREKSKSKARAETKPDKKEIKKESELKISRRIEESPFERKFERNKESYIDKNKRSGDKKENTYNEPAVSGKSYRSLYEESKLKYNAVSGYNKVSGNQNLKAPYTDKYTKGTRNLKAPYDYEYNKGDRKLEAPYTDKYNRGNRKLEAPYDYEYNKGDRKLEYPYSKYDQNSQNKDYTNIYPTNNDYGNNYPTDYPTNSDYGNNYPTDNNYPTNNDYDPNPDPDPYDNPDPYDPHPPVPEYEPTAEYNGGSSYSGFIDYKKKSYKDDGEYPRKKYKPGVYEKLPWGMANEALMISRTKVNTFDEMMGRTGQKTVQGSEKKVTKIERASPFNKKVTTPTIKSFTPTAINIAQKGLERKMDTIAKTPVKLFGAVPEEVKQKPATISRKPTNSKPAQPSKAAPVKQIFTPKKQVSFAKPSFSSGSKSTKKSSPWG